ncbi:MAG: Holliday junction branch migration protein RuvA [Clostridia bacterium]|nr:Holliday junction branch migration protein RuvA [Clostridia bacterium]
MFYSLTGQIVASEIGFIAISCGGVAFRVQTSVTTLKNCGSIGSVATVYTYTSVKEDAIELFGFSTKEELECFKQLISVNGVGPKAAISVLSELPPAKLALCVASGDAASIKKAQGIGPKIAQRIVLELKDKMMKSIGSAPLSDEADHVGVMSASVSTQEALEALLVLGYSRQEASKVLAKADETLTAEEKIKFALKNLI